MHITNIAPHFKFQIAVASRGQFLLICDEMAVLEIMLTATLNFLSERDVCERKYS